MPLTPPYPESRSTLCSQTIDDSISQCPLILRMRVSSFDMMLAGCCYPTQRFVHKSRFSLLEALRALLFAAQQVSSGRTAVIRSQYITATRSTLPSQSERWLDAFVVHTPTHISVLLGALSSTEDAAWRNQSPSNTDMIVSTYLLHSFLLHYKNSASLRFYKPAPPKVSLSYS